MLPERERAALMRAYVDACDAADERFRPLAEALERRLEIKTQVDQTGGLVFCLAVPLPGNRYAWFSEVQEGYEDTAGFGVYRDDVDGDEGISYKLPESIPWRMEHAEEIAAWAAPLLLQIAGTVPR